jgi:hypothetical protein
MKRHKLLRYLRLHGCQVEKEGGDHTWVRNLTNGLRSFVPRHVEVKPGTVRTICRHLAVPPPSEK